MFNYYCARKSVEGSLIQLYPDKARQRLTVRMWYLMNGGDDGELSS